MPLESRSREVRSVFWIARCNPIEWTSKEMRLPADRYTESGRFCKRRSCGVAVGDLECGDSSPLSFPAESRGLMFGSNAMIKDLLHSLRKESGDESPHSKGRPLHPKEDPSP